MLCNRRQGTVSHYHFLDGFSSRTGAMREEDSGGPWYTFICLCPWNLWRQALPQSKSSWYLTRWCRLHSDYSNVPDVTCAWWGQRAGANSGHLGVCSVQPPGPGSHIQVGFPPRPGPPCQLLRPLGARNAHTASIVVMMRCVFPIGRLNIFFFPRFEGSLRK